MWFADALTLSRIPLALVFWWTYGNAAASVAVVALAALTDAVDGRVARHFKHRRGLPGNAPSRGDWLDPIADKLFVLAVVATIAVHEHADVPWAVFALIVARELFFVPLALLSALRVVKRPPRRELRAAPIGKVATIAQFCAIGALLLAPAAAPALAVMAAVTGVAAIVRYAVAAIAPAP
jgi:cardiolipin synthase